MWLIIFKVASRGGMHIVSQEWVYQQTRLNKRLNPVDFKVPYLMKVCIGILGFG